MSGGIELDAGFGQDRPNAARIYDYLLGGYNNFAVDRIAGDRVVQLFPDARAAMQANRAFLRRSVTFLADNGIDQFLDLGSGIPTVGNVHEVAHQVNRAARVVYVDLDPVAIHHSRAILRANPQVSALEADIRQPAYILGHARVRELLDLNRPVAVLILAVLHFVPEDEQAYGLVSAIREALTRGSYVAISHASDEKIAAEVEAQGQQLYSHTPTPGRMRSRTEITRFFEGLALVDPGLVWAPLWRPESENDVLLNSPDASMNLVGVGRVR